MISHSKLLYVGVPACFLAGYYIFNRFCAWMTLPPGPMSLPIVGKYLSIDKNNPHLTLAEIADKYAENGLSSVYIGTNLIIIVSDFEAMKEMFSMPVFSGRPQNPLLKHINEGCGIIFAEGETWSTQRRLTLRILRDFGFGKTLTANLITEEVACLQTILEEFCKQPNGVHVLSTFQNSTNNIISSLTFAKKFDHLDEEYKRLSDSVQYLLDEGFITNPQFVFPQLMHLTWLIMKMPVVKKVINAVLSMHTYFLSEINARKAVLSSDDEPQCLCDSYILEQRKAEEHGDRTTFRDLQLIRIVLELFLAGTDTTARSLEWLMLLMAVHPKVQEKVYSEIARVLGVERGPQMADKSQLHYTQAVIDEAYRKVSLVGSGVFHRATEDTTYRGYKIPASATIFPLVYKVHHDNKYWKDPEEFRPERFLNPDNTHRSDPRVIPFQLGKRVCPGEGLAQMEVFLFFSSIMQKFKVELHPKYIGQEENIFKGFFGTLCTPNDYRLLFSLR